MVASSPCSHTLRAVASPHQNPSLAHHPSIHRTWRGMLLGRPSFRSPAFHLLSASSTHIPRPHAHTSPPHPPSAPSPPLAPLPPCSLHRPPISESVDRNQRYELSAAQQPTTSLITMFGSTPISSAQTDLFRKPGVKVRVNSVGPSLRFASLRPEPSVRPFVSQNLKNVSSQPYTVISCLVRFNIGPSVVYYPSEMDALALCRHYSLSASC